MPKPRYAQISTATTPYYHCVSRCVRRAFLCGTDALTGQSFEHRRQWIEDRLLFLADIFALDVCAYAVMSNHYHVVLHINTHQACDWSFDEVIVRWHQLFKGSMLSQRYRQKMPLDQAELKDLTQQVDIWRERLQNISWFMRVLNEDIARQANEEDQCTGRFWEGRFRSQALLDEAALLACMVYVDLNPIRARMAKTPESSEHTSIKQRIEQPNTQPLFPFVGNPRQTMPAGLPFKLDDYLELVDWTERIIRDDKRGAIDQVFPPILQRLQQTPNQWLYVTQHFESRLKGLVGSVYRLRNACEQLGYQRCVGLARCRALFN